MTGDDPRWRTLPVLCELHDQWWATRGGSLGEAQRPFSRDWEELLEAGGLRSAEQRGEAERDARLLAAEGLVELRPVKYRPNLIKTIRIPLAAEPRLASLFGDVTEPDPSAAALASVVWQPELAFLANARVAVAAGDLLRLNEFLAAGGRARPLVPIKERSLQVFGDEKRLDALLATALFRPDRLTLTSLRCEVVGEPLGWRRGPKPVGPLLIVENAATWHSYCRWNERCGHFSAVVYGKGFVIAESVRFLAEIIRELGGPCPVEYFGDLDPPGVLIPYRASVLARELGLPPIGPHLWSYRQLLELGRGQEIDYEGDAVNPAALAWLGELADPVGALFAAGKRLAQERVGWEFLQSQLG